MEVEDEINYKKIEKNMAERGRRGTKQPRGELDIPVQKNIKKKKLFTNDCKQIFFIFLTILL